MRPSLTGSCTTSSSLTCEQLHCVYTFGGQLYIVWPCNSRGLCSHGPWQQLALPTAKAGCLGVPGMDDGFQSTAAEQPSIWTVPCIWQAV